MLHRRPNQFGVALRNWIFESAARQLLWPLAGLLVFASSSGALAGAVPVRDLVMIAGAISISFAEAPASEQASWNRATQRECARADADNHQ